LLRMLKLARVLKASRILQRHLLELVMGTLEMTYAKVKMVKLVLLLVLWSHWQACLWGLVSSFMADANKPNWLSTFRAGFFVTNGHTPTAYDEYSAALYWSVMTLTSIGYGEFTAVNTPERFLGSLYMLCSGVIWTYAIGSVASIATTLDPNGVLFHNTMDSLNYFMRERGLPIPMRITLREYFQQARRVHQVSDDSSLLSRMSPLLQGTVALAANKRWLDHVWYFRSLGESREGREFIASLAKMLVIRAYVAHERLPIGQLYVLRRGLVVKLWRFLGCGKVWGEDMILDSPELIDHSQAVALTYVETFTLRRNDLDECMNDFPVAYRRVRKAARRITMQRALLKYLCETLEGRPVRSFATRSAARGFTEVRSGMSVEQKIDLLLKDRDDRVRKTRAAELARKRQRGGGALGGAFSRLGSEDLDVEDMPPASPDPPAAMAHRPSHVSLVKPVQRQGSRAAPAGAPAAAAGGGGAGGGSGGGSSGGGGAVARVESPLTSPVPLTECSSYELHETSAPAHHSDAIEQLAHTVEALGAQQDAAFGQMKQAHTSLANQVQSLADAVSALSQMHERAAAEGSST